MAEVKATDVQPWMQAIGSAMPVIGPAMNAALGAWGANIQSDANLHAAKRQFRWQKAWQREQLEYNTPKNQMARLAEAGINPHLAYAKGGDAGNWMGSSQVPQIKAGDFQGALMGLGTQLAQMRLMNAQTNLTDQKTDESGIKQDLMQAQKDLVKANPYMKPEYVDAMVKNLSAVADLKAMERNFSFSKTNDPVTGVRWDRGWLKMQRELDLLNQKYNLNNADQKIKAEIVESKDFQNDMNNFQRKFMEDGEVNREHILYFIKVLFANLMTAGRSQ